MFRTNSRGKSFEKALKLCEKVSVWRLCRSHNKTFPAKLLSSFRWPKSTRKGDLSENLSVNMNGGHFGISARR